MGAAAPIGGTATPPQNINQLAAQGIQGAGMASAGGMYYNPSQVTAGQLSNTDMSQYMNPYTQQVIDTNQADILRGGAIGMDAICVGLKAATSGPYHGMYPIFCMSSAL